jgi:hypothetical protein
VVVLVVEVVKTMAQEVLEIHHLQLPAKEIMVGLLLHQTHLVVVVVELVL